MKTGGATKVSTAKTTVSEGKVRKSLHPLQPAATDKENLVGAGRQTRSSLSGKDSIKKKNEMSAKMNGEVTTKTPIVPKVANKPVTVRSDRKSDAKKVIDKVKTDSKTVQKDVKKDVKKDAKKDVKKGGRIFKDKSVQTETKKKIEITVEDLTSEAGPSENYWQVLAERRRIDLQEALEENRILHEKIRTYEHMLEESKAVVEVLQDMLGEDRNDINQSLDDSRI